MNYELIFDLYEVFVNELIGDYWLALIIGMGAIALIGIRKHMPYQVISVFEVLFLMIMFAAAYDVIIWVFVVLGIGAFFYFMYARAFNRG